MASLARHLGMEDDLEQKVADLVLERGHVGFADRLGDLVGLLDGVGGDRGKILLAVPRTSQPRSGSRSRVMISSSLWSCPIIA